MITRRLALFRIAASSAVAATAAAPVVLAAVETKASEAPELLRLGAKIKKLDSICQRRKLAMLSARAAHDAAAPDLPLDLLVTKYSATLAEWERETDCDGKNVWPHDPHLPPRRYHPAYRLREALEPYADLEDEYLDEGEREARDYLLQRLPIAEWYEQGCEAALASSNFRKASGAHYLACEAMERICQKVAKIPALTTEGITIKAEAYDAWMRSGCERADQFAAIILGPGIAADICRVLSEGSDKVLD